MPLSAYLQPLREKHSLSAAQAGAAFDVIFEGRAPEKDIAAFLAALAEKGETGAEIAGAAASMRAHMVALRAPPGAIDIVGTGGDGRNTPNISTAAALVTAACGVPVAKHGNRAATSKSGSSDVLAALGVNLDAPLPALERCLAEAGLCFLFAPRHHPAMRHVADIRRALGIRTIFNLLGPLTNPANVKRHLIGVNDARWLRPMAEALRGFGSESAWLTHGKDGMDELSTAGESLVLSLDKGAFETFDIAPEDAGLPRAAPNALAGGDAAANAALLEKLLDGEKSAYRDIVILNAAAGLVVAQKAKTLAEAANRAAEAIDSGAARATLAKLITLTNP